MPAKPTAFSTGSHSLRRKLLPKLPGGTKISGPSGKQLRTGKKGILSRLPPVDFELGVIAGSRSWNPLFSSIIPGRDDGFVSLEATKVEGMKAFLVMPHSHSALKSCAETVRQAAHFLKHGRFHRSTDHGVVRFPEATSPLSSE